MRSALLLLLLALPAQAQQAEQVFPLPLFRDGLYTRYSANAIPDGALAEALNVLVDDDVDGVVVSRNGYSKYNTSAITDTKTVRGLWSFDASDGTKYFVAHSSMSFYKTNGDGSWTQITGLTSFSATKDFDCVQTIGKLFCGNGDVVFSWDGTSTAAVSGAPLGNLLGRFRNRLLISGVSGSKARLRGSGELDPTDWTLQIPGVSTTPFNIPFGGADDGEDITCLMGAFQDVFVVGKRQSLWGLYGFGRTDFQVRELSREVGCIEQRSVREKNNCLYWMSLRGIEKFCGASIERISDPIRDQLDTIVATAGNARSALDTAQVDFQAGNLTASGPGAPISATISPGNIVTSTAAFLDTSSTNFSGGTAIGVDFTQYPGTVVLSSVVVQDNFSDADYTTGNTTWTIRGGGFGTPVFLGQRYIDANSGVNNLLNKIYTTRFTSAVGAWSFKHAWSANSGANCSDSTQGTGYAADAWCFEFRFVQTANDTFYAIRVADDNGFSTKVAQIVKSVAGSYTVLTQSVQTITADTARTFQIARNSLGHMTLAIDGVFVSSTTDTAITSSSRMEIAATYEIGANMSNSFTDIYAYYYPSSATFTSQVFDTGLTTPTYSAFSSTYTAYNANGEGNIAFYVQASTANDGGGFTTMATSSDTLSLSALNQKRYFKYRADFTTSVSTKTPSLDAVGLSAATTGYFISQCRNPGSGTGITSWDIFSCTQELNGGSFSYYISTGNTCNSVTRTTATWNAQTNNTVIPLSTASYVAYRVLFDLDVATDAPKIYDCTINWQEGATRPPTASSVYRDRYYLAYTSSTATGSSNDHLLVLDKNDKWTLFNNHNCYSIAIYNRKMYCGSSTALGQVWLLDNGADDDGTAILARMRSKAFNFGMPERRKEYRRLYLDLEPSPDPAQTITLTGRYTLERSTPTYSLGNIDLNEDPGSIMTPRVPFPVGNPTSGRYLQLELESSGFNSPWRLFSGRLYYSPLDPE